MHTPFLVRFVYGSIKECSMDEANLFFKIGFSDQDVMFDVTRVSSILNVRLPNNGPKSVSDSLSIAKMTVITETLCGAVIPWEDAIEKPEFHALLGKGHLAQARLPSPENQRHQASTSLNDPIQEGEHAEEHPSQASHAPSFGDRLTNLEWDMTAMRKDLGDMKKKQSTWMKKIFQYLSKISKRCQMDDVDAPASPSPPPPDSE
ncbi:hypothetical protein MRB53_006196 [Persea americana]|uniref:Uncharacterized protein n=1 Tax=Persea americana TaxID=3435 RepID=A0ACC2MG04_PERAE|nr:hypothetical protein MRB53_006196 [Persea americana]